MQIDWPDLRTGLADLWDGAEVVIFGWMAPIDFADRYDYFLLVAQPTCCIGCLPSNPTACFEVFAAEPVLPSAHSVRLIGQCRRLVDHPAGWRHQPRDARLGDTAPPAPVARRPTLSAGGLGALPPRAPDTRR